MFTRSREVLEPRCEDLPREVLDPRCEDLPREDAVDELFSDRIMELYLLEVPEK